MTIRAAVAAVSTLVASLAGLASPACAMPGDGGFAGHGPHGGPGRHRFLPRPDAAPEGAPMMPGVAQPVRDAGEDPRGLGRLSPEERRQLRRDIRSAGEDVYRRPPPMHGYPPLDAPPPPPSPQFPPR